MLRNYVCKNKKINLFDVDTIIRIGSCGALQENVNLYDVIIAQAAST
ncbi:phosphorylase family protein, partial [Staphylococcus aureus]